MSTMSQDSIVGKELKVASNTGATPKFATAGVLSMAPPDTVNETVTAAFKLPAQIPTSAPIKQEEPLLGANTWI